MFFVSFLRSIARQIALKCTCFCICFFLFWLALLKNIWFWFWNIVGIVAFHFWTSYLQVLDLLLPGLFSFGRVVICFVSFYWKKNACGMHSKLPQVKKKKATFLECTRWTKFGCWSSMSGCFPLLFEHCQGNPWQTFHSEAIHCGGGNMILHCHTD